MAGIDPSIPLGVKVPDGMSSLASMVSAARGMQQLQTGRIEQERSGVALEQERGALDARKAVAQVIADPSFRDPETGLYDLNKVGGAIFEADPKNYVAKEAISALASYNNDTINVKKNAIGLADVSRTMLGSTVGALAMDPAVTKAKVGTALDMLKEQAPDTAPIVAVWRKYLDHKNIPDDPAALKAFLVQARSQAMPPATQQTAQTPNPVNAGATMPNINPAYPSAPISTTVPPTAKETPAQDLLGNPYIIDRTPDGRVVPKAMPGSGSPPPLLRFPPGESQQSAQQLTSVRSEVNQAAAKVPEQHFNNKQIEKLADTAVTGTGAQNWSKVFSTLGLQFAPGDATANYQQLGHFMSLQSQANAKAMGAGTDAARSISEQATGSTAWDAKAIKRATKINDALSTGVDYFNRGMEAAINNPDNQKSIFAARDFQNAWSQTFDVNAMRLHNAIQDGDKAEQKTVIDGVGGKNSPGARALAAKLRALDKLIAEGHL